MKRVGFVCLVAACLFPLSPVSAEMRNGMDADVVVGQPDFVTTTGGTTAGKFSTSVRGVWSDGKRLFVSDFGNRRVLIWNSIPRSNFTDADVVLGQTSFTASVSNSGGRSASSLGSTRGVTSDGRRLYVSDFGNSRLLIWNSIPTSNFTPADVVLGQANFTVAVAGTDASTMTGPNIPFSDGTRLALTEYTNSRLLIWNTIPTRNAQPADLVIGQPDFVSSTANNGGLSASSLNDPHGVFIDPKGRVFVSDQSNHRVLIWNTFPTRNFQPADVVLGQPDFRSNSLNNGGISARSLNSPRSVFSDGRRLFVTDAQNHRVLIWDRIPTSNFAPADAVLGQSTMSSGIASGVGSRGGFNTPSQICAVGTRFFIIDNLNRGLIFNFGAGSVASKLGPQFTQGKALVGKVFWDLNGNGVQDESVNRESLIVDRNDTIHNPRSTNHDQRSTINDPRPTIHDPRPTIPESGIEGIKVVSDTGIYAITDSDGKYHFPYIETGQRILKIDESTLPEGAKLTTESPRKLVVTEGVLSKISFGINVPPTGDAERGPRVLGAPERRENARGAQRQDPSAPLLHVTVTQDPVLLKPKLTVKAERHPDKIVFFIETNYAQFFEEGILTLYDKDMKLLQEIALKPVPYLYELPLTVISKEPFQCSVSVSDDRANKDITQLTVIERQSL